MSLFAKAIPTGSSKRVARVESSNSWRKHPHRVRRASRVARGSEPTRRYRCEVVGVWRTENLHDGSDASISVTLKRCEDVLDLSALAFGVAHPAMLRRIGFAAIERSRKSMQSPGYGRPNSNLSKVDLLYPAPDTWFIGGVGCAGHLCQTLQGATKYLTDKVNTAAKEDILEMEVAA